MPKTGRPPIHKSGAMTKVIRFRASAEMAAWLDVQGNRSEVARSIIAQVMEEEREEKKGEKCT